jgi:hypothetical protein
LAEPSIGAAWEGNPLNKVATKLADAAIVRFLSAEPSIEPPKSLQKLLLDRDFLEWSLWGTAVKAHMITGAP